MWAHQDSNLEPRDSRVPVVSDRRGLSLHPSPWRMGCGTQITFDKKNNAIELENYSTEPVRLNNLELEVRK